ncbi:hypothetical protein AYR62_10945 [Secundilactobacillus paracollinoides]|uniref:Uncharacterized protein n=1 Tax=Secundilactobacillus paracollinoides TaxID=240427 RepID=A0A1B2IY64_9LACO|nr:hypothetical protein [Secundilactobacillus paracollinoides]ANZ61026.1 hypothetical protein AYR61_06505 [Secundilactobacillus paracollinoides]ANZ64551.1 hypothetical protein AYR62_10945 [Secundilactobacillus paracollinoides]ANZ66948.1 hypothetical protein AYR63_07260 [Secundilactobacillus paracollinoides]KRL77001.1 hypothetical protein FC17_GL001458 [Secundilactobacillus paracollinoides DSM 15502 = JCM 11969]
MTKKAKIIGIIMSVLTAACLWTVGQAHAVFAAVRLTSAIQKGTTSQSTRRVTVRPTTKLHVVLTAYDNNQVTSTKTFTYKIFRYGKLYKTYHVKNGHVATAVKVKPGKYSVRAYDGNNTVTFTGGISSSNEPHFI